LRRLQRLERAVERCWPLPQLADHHSRVLRRLQKRDSQSLGPLRRVADLKRIGGWMGAPNTRVLSWCGTKLLTLVGGPAGCRSRLTDACEAG